MEKENSKYRPLTPWGIITDLTVAIRGEEEPPTLRESAINGTALIITFLIGLILFQAIEYVFGYVATLIR